jgi:hypothetical protein
MCAGVLAAGAMSAHAGGKGAMAAIDPATGKLRPVEHDDKVGVNASDANAANGNI